MGLTRPPPDQRGGFKTVFLRKKSEKPKKLFKTLQPSGGYAVHSMNLELLHLLEEEKTNRLKKTAFPYLHRFDRNFELKMEENCRYFK